MKSEDTESGKALVANEELHREMFRLIQEQAVIQSKLLNLIEASKPENKSKKFWADLDSEIERCKNEITWDIRSDIKYEFMFLETKFEQWERNLKHAIPDEYVLDFWPLMKFGYPGIRLPDYDFPNPYRKRLI